MIGFFFNETSILYYIILYIIIYVLVYVYVRCYLVENLFCVLARLRTFNYSLPADCAK